MKILWQSNSRRTPTGYGNQTDLFVRALAKAGHEMTIFATYGAEGNPFRDEEGIITLPRLLDAWGNDIIEAHMADLDADLLITLIDPWVLDPSVYGGLPWAAWAPVDSAPLLPANKRALQYAKWIFAMSHFGEEQLVNAGYGGKTFYVPHGVDTDLFTPVNREEARAKVAGMLGVDLAGKFLVTMNSANKGSPSRKGFSEALRAFKAFSDGHPDAVLYLHTEKNGIFGEHLPTIVEGVELDPSKVIYAPHYRYVTGKLPAVFLNDMYNAADVFLQPSHGEGFGIPIVEAQAAGCPVIVTNFSAMPELCFEGWTVNGDLWMHAPGAYQMLPDIRMLINALESAYSLLHDEGFAKPIRSSARGGALAYDYRRVARDCFLPALEEIQRDLSEKKKTQEKRAGQRALAREGQHEHVWSSTGLWDKDELCFPCRSIDCEAYLGWDRNGVKRVHADGFGTTINGIKLDIEDDPSGGVAKIVCREIAQSYDLDSIPFQAGDVAIDIGAQVGIVSIYLAKRYPFLKIYAFEPVPVNFARLQRNLAANGITSVIAINKAITGDGRELKLHGDLAGNSGGISAFTGESGPEFIVPSTTLQEVFTENEIRWVTLLKIDCEGAEYEILTPNVLRRVKYLRGEFHSNNLLRAQGCDPNDLIKEVASFIPSENFKAHICEIAAARQANEAAI